MRKLVAEKKMVPKEPIVVDDNNELVERIPIGNHKKTEKPWILFYQITNETSMKEHSWFYKPAAMNTWVPSSWDKFTTVDYAIRELNKMGRTYNNKNEPLNEHWKFAGREFKLVNKETNEEILLDITDKEVVKKDEKI